MNLLLRVLLDERGGTMVNKLYHLYLNLVE